MIKHAIFAALLMCGWLYMLEKVTSEMPKCSGICVDEPYTK